MALISFNPLLMVSRSGYQLWVYLNQRSTWWPNTKRGLSKVREGVTHTVKTYI